MTNQEAFARMVLHLRKQGAKSADGVDTKGTPVCRYRSGNGMRCAVGVLITDDVYSADFEGQVATGPEVATALKYLGLNLLFARAMQDVHDRMTVAQWETGFEYVARTWDLTLPAPGHEHEYIPSPCAECEPAKEVVA